MSNKENIDSYWIQNSSIKAGTRCTAYDSEKPPLPQKIDRKRKGSQPILRSIKNIVWLPPISKRTKSVSMGSICIKSNVEHSQPHSNQSRSTKRFAAKVSPCMDVVEPSPAIPRLDSNTKYMFYADKSVSNGHLHLEENAEDAEPDDLYPEVFCDLPAENGEMNIVDANGETVDLASSSTTMEFKLPEVSVMGPKHQLSLPNLRSHNTGGSSKPRKRFSQSETMKTCNGSANLLETKNTFNEFRVRSVSKSVSENVRNVEKRKKRLPTIENGVHVLENDKVNYYQVLEEIGRGSFGSVCKCKSHKDNKCYAMKIISKKRLVRKNRQLSRAPGSKSNPLEPLHREVAILKKMDHPNVVKLIEVIDDVEVDNLYMIFELMEKGVVIDIPTYDPIPEERSRKLFRDLLLGIEYLHYSKIIHRDIKPSNLLLDEHDHVKIADFGVSNMFEGDNDLLSKYAGSPAFQAPEVLDYNAQDKYSGKAADIWAMGITLYCFLYGKCPFFSENVMELSEMIKNDLVSFPDTPVVNPQVFDLISRMLSKDAKERITMDEIKEHPWVTEGGTYLLPCTEDHCTVIEVTEEEVRNSIKIISKVSSLVIAKSILKAKSFLRNKQSKGGR